MKVYIAFCYFYLNLNKMSQADLFKSELLQAKENSLGDDGAIDLAKMLKDDTSLTRLDLSKNSIGDDGAIALAETLKEVNRSLRWLILSNNSIGNNGAKALTKMYNDSTSLVWLILFDNPIKKITLEIMNKMTLHKLVHSKDSIVSEKAKYLAEIFSKFKKVKRSVEKSHRRKNKSKTKSGPKRSSNRKNY
jgi:Ran GTPase-activating protein (RanGAP) involved in mRNA processing and transport